MIVFDVSQSEKINELFTKDNMRVLKDYSLTCIIFEYEKSLPPSYLNKSSMKSESDIEKDAKYYIFDNLEEELGIIYGKEICTEQVMNSAEKVFHDIKESCRDLILHCNRLSDSSKKRFIDKLDNIVFLLGYNKDYVSPFELIPAKDGGDLLSNTVIIKKTSADLISSKLAQKTDRRTWDMSPVTVNAVYNPTVNTITIPAAMLSKPIFDPSDSEFRNLGMLGYVIAHEMNHAFDSNGYLFDKNGCYDPDSIDKFDDKIYKELMLRAKEYYDNYTLIDIYHINGKQTLSENLADIGAVQCITNITDNKEDLREMFESIALQWASLQSVNDTVIQLDGDEHSPSEARVNAVLSSNDKFYIAYDIKETDKMYVSPEKRIKVW